MVISPPSLPTPMTQSLQFKPVSSHRRTPLLTDLNPYPPPEPPDPPDRVSPSQSKSSTIYLRSPSTASPPLLTQLELEFRVPEIYLLQHNRSIHSEKEHPPPLFVELHKPDLRLSHLYGRMPSMIIYFPHWSVCPRRVPPPTVRGQDSDYQLECYLSNSVIRAFLVSLQNICVDVGLLLWMLAVLKSPSLQYTALQSLEDWTFDVDTLVGEGFVGTVLLDHYSSYAFWSVSLTSNISGVSVSNHTIFIPDCFTCNSTILPCSSGNRSFTEASRQFTVRSLASVYRVHIAQICDVVLDFVSVSSQLSLASRVYKIFIPLLMSIQVKFRQLWSLSTAIVMRSALYMALTLEFPKLKVFSDNSTLIRAISGNLQSKEIIGTVKDIRSISSGFASISFSELARSENGLDNVLAKMALQAFLSV